MLHRAQLRIAAAMIPAIALAACSDREAEIAERNARMHGDAAMSQADAAELKAEREARRKIARDSRKEALADFYQEDDDDAASDDADDDNDEGDGGDSSDDTGSFDDPTSDYYDNTYAVPESTAADSSGDAGEDA